ncbi:MAG: pyridoxamine 5'-phosphate oxidase family protein [Holophagaceae bacterium]|nr:pyridoxamine 5'-phosphate oxidase family protein [Holophagaceae bacterium]
MSRKFMERVLTPKVRQAEEAAYGRAFAAPVGAPPDALGADERAFIAARDSFYMATVTEDGWPYVQHRGGPKGFLKVLDAHTLAFADLGGNRQLVTVGNLDGDGRVALFLMDYAQQVRLKILGRAKVHDLRSATGGSLGLPLPPRTERLVTIDVEGYDWNCPQHITPRYDAEAVAEALAPLKARIAELEARLSQGLGPA